MPTRKYQLKMAHLLFWLVILIVLLSFSRVLWMQLFQNQKHEPIHEGQFDLQEWDAEDGHIVLLDGEWMFYPSQLVMDDSEEGLSEMGNGFIRVPGKWNEDLSPSETTPYGYGSYRLRLYVDPEKNTTYSLRVPSVRSASELYVNGRLLTHSGIVATSKEEYTAKNLPYSASFTADENGVIDIVIQVANYRDNRSAGIVRSIKFGSEQAIAQEIKISMSMQLLAAIIFLIHSLYSLGLFLLGNKDKKLLYFGLLTFMIMFTTLLSHDEKLFHQLFYIGSTWDFRLTNAAVMVTAYAILGCTNHRELPYWNRIYPVYRTITLGTAGLTLFLTMNQVTVLFPLYFILLGISIIISLVAIIQKASKDIRGNILQLFSILALIHHFVWLIIWRESGFSLIYYPFDLIIAMGCLTIIWSKDYFNMLENTKELATTLQRMNDHKDQFLANTAHEFKNPLHSILNLSQSALKRERHLMQDKSIKELETILSVGQQVTLVVNDLIDVMSLRDGHPRIEKKVLFIQSIVNGVLDMLALNAEVKDLKIENKIPKDIPPVYADEGRIIQIVFNLLHNAVKYSHEGVISIEAFVKEGRAYTVISDTGIGMDEDMLERLFRPYEQASKDDILIEGGFGLGLSISKQLVELHGGTLETSSVLGKGSKFTFSLELAELQGNEVSHPLEYSQRQSKREVATVSESLESLATGELDYERPNLLIVDDDPINLQVLEAILPLAEYNLTMVTSGKEALEVLELKEWDLVISDIMMPLMSGYELTRSIRERFTLIELPILLLTARSRPEDIQTGFVAGANDYVTKPVDALEIKSRIVTLTTIKQLAREQLRLEAIWLQAQIQPHFLFNTLNAITALSYIDLDKMHKLIDKFSLLLRHKFQFQDIDKFVTIEEELDLVRSYLYIERIRFEERLQVVWEIDSVEEIKMPPLIIQPLVENAINHGIMKRVQGGKITIRVRTYETYIEIAVEDDGVGIDERRLSQILERKVDNYSGIGLINTNQRLKRHFGSGLTIESTLDKGTKITFHIPNSNE